jgi:TRAF3-interacting protein 1
MRLLKIHAYFVSIGNDYTEAASVMIGALIQKPKMAQKLLQKPPFRFIHDIATALLSATGFLTGLYDAEELDSASIKETSQKLKFLQKLIEFAAVATNSDLCNYVLFCLRCDVQ